MAAIQKVEDTKTPQKNIIENSVGILTIIGPELTAVKSAFGITEDDRVVGSGTLSYEKVIDNAFTKQIKIVVWPVGCAGNIASAADAAKIIAGGIKFLVICGIAAGVRDKVKVGDVVIPRAIVDTTVKVAEKGKLKHRPVISGPLKGVLQMNAAVPVKSEDLNSIFSSLSQSGIKAPYGKKAEYDKFVAKVPSVHEAAILSDNMLLRDPKILDKANSLHQQIRAAEMEASGCVHACVNEYPPIPWFVVRGISDFGDDFKDDAFHHHAATAAASYLFLYLSKVLDLRIFQSNEKHRNTSDLEREGPLNWLENLIQHLESNAQLSQFFQLKILNEALFSTFHYFSLLEMPDYKIAHETKVELSILWHNASNEIRVHDDKTYESCFVRSKAWHDPLYWNDDAIRSSSYSYSTMRQRLQRLGYVRPISVEFDESVLKKHIMMESYNGEKLNMGAPANLKSWEINKLIWGFVAAPGSAMAPSFYRGDITVLLEQELYRRWRKRNITTFDSRAVGWEQDLSAAGILVGKKVMTGTFKPSIWFKISNAFERNELLDMDFEFPDSSLCATAVRITELNLRQRTPEGACQGDISLWIESSDHLFCRYKYVKRWMDRCDSYDNIKNAVADALCENSWQITASSSSGWEFSKNVNVRHEEEDCDVLFEGKIDLNHNGAKTVFRLQVTERKFYCLSEVVSKLGTELYKSIDSLLHKDS